MTTIYLVRHGEAISNLHADQPRSFHKQWGELQSPLTEKGETQAKERALKFKNIKFDAIFSSDLTRATQTAEIIKMQRDIAIQATKILRERVYYEYVEKLEKEGQTREKIEKEMWRALQQLDEKGKLAYKHGEGMESAEDAATRLITFLREIAIAYTGKTILVINHGNNMRSLLSHLGFAKFDELPTGAIINTGYVILQSDGVDFFIKETHDITKHTYTTRTI